MWRVLICSRVWVESVVASLAAISALVTAVYPAWLEILFGEDLDAGSGAMEWTVVAALTSTAVTLGVLVRRDFRRQRQAT
jgi:hypothetical protein